MLLEERALKRVKISAEEGNLVRPIESIRSQGASVGGHATGSSCTREVNVFFFSAGKIEHRAVIRDLDGTVRQEQSRAVRLEQGSVCDLEVELLETEKRSEKCLLGSVEVICQFEGVCLSEVERTKIGVSVDLA